MSDNTKNAASQTAEKTTAKATDDMVTIRLPKARNGEESVVFVGVNGRGWRIQRGVDVKVPAYVAEVLRNAEKAEDINDAFIRDNENKNK